MVRIKINGGLRWQNSAKPKKGKNVWDGQASYVVLRIDEEIPIEEEWDFESPSAVFTVRKAGIKEDIDFDAHAEDESNPTNNEAATCTFIKPDES